MIKDFLILNSKDMALGLIDSSYWICLFTCLLALILYCAGQKKTGKYVSISFVVYFLLQSFKLGLK